MHRFRYSLLWLVVLMLHIPGNAQPDTLHSTHNKELVTVTEDDAIPLLSLNYGETGKAFFRMDKTLKSQLAEADHIAGLYTASPVRDTLAHANWHKHYGYLQARIRKFDIAKAETKQAIELYRQMGRNDGMAVAQHDLSWIYLLQHQYDSALYCEKQARAFWLSRADTVHLLTSTIHLHYLYQCIGNYRMAHELSYQGEQLMSGTVAVSDQQRYDLYTVSRQLYRTLKDQELEKPWAEKLTALQRQSRNKGKRLRSAYEELPEK